MKSFEMVVAAMTLAACGGAQTTRYDGLDEKQAVGTYIGGGSMFGSDPCTYTGTPGVFAPPATGSAADERGPRFVQGPGTITKVCNGNKHEKSAVTPTGAVIDGPTKVSASSAEKMFKAYLALDGKLIDGEGSLDWQLGKDCDGVATFAAVLGAQDTGGADRSRTLVPSGKGTCTLSVTVTTGSTLYPTFAPATFRAETKVTVE